MEYLRIILRKNRKQLKKNGVNMKKLKNFTKSQNQRKINDLSKNIVEKPEKVYTSRINIPETTLQW